LNGNVVAFYTSWDLGGWWEGAFAVLASRDFGATFTTVREFRDWSLWENIGNVAIGPGGTVHLVYRGPFESANYDVLYEWSAPPYTKWSTPVRLNDDAIGANQRRPVIAVQQCGDKAVLHAAWPDDRREPNRHDVFYTRKIANRGFDWSRNIRISRSYPGSHVETLLTAGGSRAFAVWGAAADIIGSRIVHGISCP
jgi:hypothetical protein